MFILNLQGCKEPGTSHLCKYKQFLYLILIDLRGI